MSEDRVTKWFTIATNAAVLIGVILLVIEIRQTNDLARLQALQERRYLGQQSEMAFYDPEISRVWVKSIIEPENMTLEEVRAMDAYLSVHLWQASHIRELEETGLMTEAEARKWIEDSFDFIFSNTFAQTWWKKSGYTWSYLSDFDDIITSFDENRTRRDFEAIQRALEEQSENRETDR